MPKNKTFFCIQCKKLEKVVACICLCWWVLPVFVFCYWNCLFWLRIELYSSLRLILQLAYSFCSVEQSCKTVCSLILIIAHNVILFLQCSLVLLFLFLVRMLLVSQELIYFMDLYSLTCCYEKWLGPFFFQLKSVDISQHGLNVLASGTV